jgi:hypothetical protein
MLQSKELRGITEPKGRKQDKNTREIIYTKPTKIKEGKTDGQYSIHGKVRYLKYIDLFIYIVYLTMLSKF